MLPFPLVFSSAPRRLCASNYCCFASKFGWNEGRGLSDYTTTAASQTPKPYPTIDYPRGLSAVLSEAPKLLTVLAAVGILVVSLGFSPVSQAFDFGDMMNPGKWMGGSRDRYDDYYGGPWGGPYGGGPYGGPYGGGPYGGPWGGYGPGPYGGGFYRYPGSYGGRGYSRAAPQPPAAPAAKKPSAPAASSSDIEELRQRIEELESQQQQAASPPPSDWGSAPSAGDAGSPPPASDWGSAPAFRPLRKY
jgi:hypothetical protein